MAMACALHARYGRGYLWPTMVAGDICSEMQHPGVLSKCLGLHVLMFYDVVIASSL